MLFSDGLESKIDWLFGVKCNLLLFLCEFGVDFIDVVIKFRIWNDFLQLVIDLFELYVKNPFLVGQHNVSGLLSIVKIFSCKVFSHFNDRKVPEISSAFNDN